MTRWDFAKDRQLVRKVRHDEVKCYVEWEFDVARSHRHNSEKYKRGENPTERAFVLKCGVCDGEEIDLFELQDWFDENRDWINSLREEIE